MTDDARIANKKAGRPRKYDSSAARQKAYRLRMKAAGFREVKTMIRDVRDRERKLVSDIIDLSKFKYR
jgi:hypothetical protein